MAERDGDPNGNERTKGTVNDGMVVDLHIHTNRSSYCSSLDPQEMLDQAKELGLDAVAVTEHSVTRGAQIAYEMGLEQGFTVFRGIEVYTKMGDVIVFGLGGDAHYDADFHELMEEVKAGRCYGNLASLAGYQS